MLLLSLALSGSLLVSACAGDKPPEGPTGEPMEALSFVTDKGEFDYWVEIADDDTERARGLMYREPLADDRGMLFEFPEMGARGFWMQNTPSALDIIYVDDKGRIVSIAHNATPFSTQVLPSAGPAKGVVEVRAGRADAMGAKAGDTVKHTFFGNE